MAEKNEQPKKQLIFHLIILITFLISIVAYHTYFVNGWYVQDDYISLEPGGARSILDSAKGITDWLYSGQARYQPVRIFLFSAFTHLFQEEYAVYYNFALHLVNLLLLSFLLKKFKASTTNILIIVLIFSLFGRYRMMESPSVMIAGSGLSLFFILASSLSLIKTLEISNWSSRKFAWFILSILSYLGLTFSYEVAFPLILVIGYIFFAFHFKSFRHKKIFNIKEYLYLLPYFASLLVYYFFFRRAESMYEGAKIAWGYDILIRLKSYLAYTFTYPAHLKLNAEGIIFLILYFIAINLAIKTERPDQPDSRINNDLSNNGNLIIFGAIFYFASVVLFCLNQWVSATSIMRHHTYLMTAGSSILLATTLVGLQWLFAEPVRKIYYRLLIYIMAPFIILFGLNDTLDMYKNEHDRTASIKLLKGSIQSSVKDPERIDAILVKNFFHDYYRISGMDGAFLQWFDFKKSIFSGREITYVKDNKIKFKGPLTYYHPPDQEHEADNNKTEIFYFDDVSRNVLFYSDFINIETGENLHQLKQVMKDGATPCDANYFLDAILKNFHSKNTVAITLDPEINLRNFLRNVSRVELNGRPVKKVFASRNNIYLDMRYLSDINYIFLKIVSADKEFKHHIKEIRLSSSQETKLATFNIKDEHLAFEKSSLVSNPNTTGNSQELVLEWGDGFYDIEHDPTRSWRWGSPRGEIYLINNTQRLLAVTVIMKLGTSYKKHSNLIITGPGFKENLKINADPLLYSKIIAVPPGRHAVIFESNAKKPVGSTDPRSLSFNISDFQITDCSSR
ncbi:MAG: hypothetical protein ACYC1T_15520 [Sulfuricaulis sp.]